MFLGAHPTAADSCFQSLMLLVLLVLSERTKSRLLSITFTHGTRSKRSADPVYVLQSDFGNRNIYPSQVPAELSIDPPNTNNGESDHSHSFPA